MGATDTIKEFARIATTAGLTKDVIDLLDKKASLLAEQVVALEQETRRFCVRTATLNWRTKILKHSFKMHAQRVTNSPRKRGKFWFIFSKMPVKFLSRK
jgi:hypothetical protein